MKMEIKKETIMCDNGTTIIKEIDENGNLTVTKYVKNGDFIIKSKDENGNTITKKTYENDKKTC